MQAAKLTQDIWKGVAKVMPYIRKIDDAGTASNKLGDRVVDAARTRFHKLYEGVGSNFASARAATTPAPRLGATSRGLFGIALRTPASIFLGVGTVVATLALGIGGLAGRLGAAVALGVVGAPAAIASAVIEAPHQVFRAARWAVKGSDATPAVAAACGCGGACACATTPAVEAEAAEAAEPAVDAPAPVLTTPAAQPRLASRQATYQPRVVVTSGRPGMGLGE